jgi:HSP20 family protein
VLRFDPFRDLDRLTEQLLGSQAGTARAPRFMPMDLYKAAENYILKADLPGVDPGSVDVNVDNGTLTIRAERTLSPDEGSADWITSERFTGTYLRQLSLGDGVDADNITADYSNGVLTLTIPVAERAKPRRIQVAAGDEANRPEVTAG